MSKKYKSLLILSLSMIVLLILFLNFNSLRQYLRNNLPDGVKVQVKELVFGKKYLNEISVYRKQNYNSKILPTTQFEYLNLKKFQLTNFKPTDQIHYGKIKGTGITTKKFFIEPTSQGLLTVYYNGEISLIGDLDNFNQKTLNSNLDNFFIKSVLDIAVIKDKLFISYSFNQENEKKCSYLGVVETNLELSNLSFKNIFKTNTCLENTLGGRMHYYNHLSNEGFLLTTGASGKVKNLAQIDDSYYGKILFFNLKNYESIIFSKGHRNPQGLTINNGIILETEHGEYGGDEINKIVFKNNYGFPISSYGDQYDFDEILDNRFNYSFKKNHTRNNFYEPIYSFVPSIGISEIIKIPEEFSKYWIDNYFITSLNGRSIYRVKFDNSFSKILFIEKI